MYNYGSPRNRWRSASTRRRWPWQAAVYVGRRRISGASLVPEDWRLSLLHIACKYLVSMYCYGSTCNHWRSASAGRRMAVAGRRLRWINACVKGHLEPTHLKSSPRFTFSTKSLGQDSPSVHLFSKTIGSRFTTVKIKLGKDSPSWLIYFRSRFTFK